MGIVRGGVAAHVIFPMLIDLHRQGPLPLEQTVNPPTQVTGDALDGLRVPAKDRPELCENRVESRSVGWLL